MPEHASHPTGGKVVTLAEATRVWFAISWQTFGGPAGQIAVMQHTLVDRLRWIGPRRFQHALNYCMLLPGPEAQQLAIYTGWLLNGTLGGLIAGTLFVLPGVLALGALSAIYVQFGDTGLVNALFAGIGPAVIAIVAHAVLRLGSRSLGHPALVATAVAAFAALTLFNVPFPIVVFAAGAVGWLLGRNVPSLRTPPSTDPPDDGPAPLISDDLLHHDRPSTWRSLLVLTLGLVVWFAPVGAFAVLVDSTDVFTDQALFFSGAAVVTFGGAYAVLAYVAQQAVQVYGWLAPGEMVRGLGMAETTPGPLIMVVQFVAFMGAYRDPGTLNPWLAATLASLLVVWVTFVPCFIWVFLGAPYVERLRANPHLTAALGGITAAVVGVIANLAIYFSLHTLFDSSRRFTDGPFDLDVPVLGSWDPVAFAITAVALGLVFWRGWSPLRTLGACAVIGLAAFAVGLPV